MVNTNDLFPIQLQAKLGASGSASSVLPLWDTTLKAYAEDWGKGHCSFQKNENSEHREIFPFCR